jgi:hypothetical protein
MFYENWMTYIKDDVKITKVVMPGAHNAGTKGMIFLGRCQDGTMLEQYEYGVRKFGIRLKSKHGKPYIGHGISTGMPAEEAFASLGEILKKYPDDFFILDIRSYPNQPVGPITLKYDCDPKVVDALIEKYLEPEKYALTDFDDIKNVTLGDIRKSGKRYVIHHAKEIYKYSRNVNLLEPWDPKVFGLKPEKFVEEDLKYLKNLESDGFFWFQTQQTPNAGTEMGLTKWPPALDKLDRPLFPGMMAKIAADPVMLEKVNIVAGDFMTFDHMKENEILYLNLCKDTVKPELREEFAKAIGKTI